MAKSGFAKQHLRSFIERIERLLEEKDALTADIREVYSEAKGQGFDTKIMRQVVALRKLDTADRQEREAMLDLYKSALGMDGTPLGDFARDRGGNGGTQQNAPRPSNRDVSADGKPSSEAGPQAEASHVETETETPAVHEGERAGVSPANVSADVTAGETAPEQNAGQSKCALTTIDHNGQGATPSEESFEPAAVRHGGSRTPGETVCVTGGERAALNIPLPPFLDRRPPAREPAHA